VILDFLVAQLNQRFQHEKRARVCLWFDERQEFSRLLPPLRVHLDAMKQPPFRLLEYDAGEKHGQIWLKYQIHRALEQAALEARKHLRFVLYLPLPEERLDSPSENGDPPLNLLAEYRLTGVMWRIGGKRPTLFTFLRQASAALSDNPAAQRRLYEGGRDSLLAKYVAKFIDRPAVFWATTLMPELTASRLIGDVDQTILDLAVDPETTWKDLRDKGLGREFLDSVRERYGFEGPDDSPADWVRELVAVLALTETYLGYGEPPDFPFTERLPSLALRPHHVQLLQRWLRDSESRAAWDRWVQEVEAKQDLTMWAKGREGLSFGFPHLVRLRWQEVVSAFEEAEPKASATTEFFEQYGNLIAKEAEYTRASYSPVGSWELLRGPRDFLKACEGARQWAERADNVADLARIYIECAPDVERQHIRIRYDAEEQNLPAVSRVVDRAYASYTNTLNARFFERLVASGTPSIPGIEAVTPRLEQAIWRAKGRRAVIIVDALRYDCAFAIKESLREHDVEIGPMVAALPTITAVGMTALMPLTGAEVAVEIKGNNVHPTVNNKDTSARANRLAFLADFGADCREIGDLEATSEPPKGLGELLVVFGHDEVDHIGHGDAQTLIRHVHLEVERLARLIRKLHRWGYPRVHVVTDHGFILLDKEKLPEEVLCDKDWCHPCVEGTLCPGPLKCRPPGGDVPVCLGRFRVRCSAAGPGVLQGGEILLTRRSGSTGADHPTPRLEELRYPGEAHRCRGGPAHLRTHAHCCQGHPPA
jgi:hypothetical protein